MARAISTHSRASPGHERSATLASSARSGGAAMSELTLDRRDERMHRRPDGGETIEGAGIDPVHPELVDGACDGTREAGTVRDRREVSKAIAGGESVDGTRRDRVEREPTRRHRSCA